MITPTFLLIASIIALLFGIELMRAADSGTKAARALLTCAAGVVGLVVGAIWWAL